VNLAIISGAYPPQLDGIGDHTRHIARELAGRGNRITVFTSIAPEASPDPDVQVVRVLDPSHPSRVLQLRALLEDGEFDEVLLQFNPFGFGPAGFTPWLPWVLQKWKAGNSRVQLSILFHETYVPPERMKFLIMLSYQFPQFAILCRLADRIFVTTDRWHKQARAFSGGKESVLLPVGSNLPPAKTQPMETRRQLGWSNNRPVLTVFGTAHVSRLLPWIGRALAELPRMQLPPVLLYIGSDGSKVREICPSSVQLVDAGRVEAARAADLLVASDLMLAPFIDGLSTRRGSVMAAFQQGLPVVSTFSSSTDQVLLGREDLGIHLTSVADGAECFAKRVGRVLAQHQGGLPLERLQAFYSKNFDWPVLADIFLEQMTASSEPERT